MWCLPNTTSDRPDCSDPVQVGRGSNVRVDQKSRLLLEKHSMTQRQVTEIGGFSATEHENGTHSVFAGKTHPR